MKLADYLSETGQTYRQFAVALGCNAAQVHRWASGKRLPTLEVCSKIRAATGGKVSADDFLPSVPLAAQDDRKAA